MTISALINDYAKDYSPYMRGLVNHLPMGQLALYFMSNDLEKVRDYSAYYNGRFTIDPLNPSDKVIKSIDDCLGKRDLYGPLLDYLNENVNDDNLEEYLSYILNTYALGMSSGLFHTLIRLAYAIEGYEEDKGLLDEVKRALSYYVTAYRGAGQFTRAILAEDIISEMEGLRDSSDLNTIRAGQNSMGQKMKALYNSDIYMKDYGFIIKGQEDDKVQALLDLTLRAYINSKASGDILILHCITGLHALMVLRDYFKDFNQALDIMTTCIVSHLVTLDNLDLQPIENQVNYSFDDLIARAIESPDVHTIKLTYSANEVYRKYKRNDLKIAADKRIVNS